VSGQRWIGVCLASAREIAAQAESSHGESRGHGPLIHETPAGSPRKRRHHLETASGEGNFTTARVTSRDHGERLRPFLVTTRRPGLRRFEDVLADRTDCRCQTGIARTPRKRGEPCPAQARQCRRSPDRTRKLRKRWSRERRRRAVRIGRRRSGSWKALSLTRRRRKRSWLSLALGFNHRREGATGSVRGRTSDRPPAQQAAGNWERRSEDRGSKVQQVRARWPAGDRRHRLSC